MTETMEISIKRMSGNGNGRRKRPAKQSLVDHHKGFSFLFHSMEACEQENGNI